MKFGICTGPDMLKTVQTLGIDYFESSVTGLNALTDDEFKDLINELKQSSIKCEVLNVLFPGTISVVGTKVDMAEIKNYLEHSFTRAQQIGIEIVVFGSGRARFCPEGFSKETALEQLCEVGHVLGKAAKNHGLSIALEPLNANETNMINTVEEGLALVDKISHPNFKLLADFYHMMTSNDNADSLLKCKDKLIHTHIATKDDRLFPLNITENDFASFFKALKAIGYDARMSIEGTSDDQVKDTPIAMKCLHDLENNER